MLGPSSGSVIVCWSFLIEAQVTKVSNALFLIRAQLKRHKDVARSSSSVYHHRLLYRLHWDGTQLLR